MATTQSVQLITPGMIMSGKTIISMSQLKILQSVQHLFLRNQARNGQNTPMKNRSPAKYNMVNINISGAPINPIKYSTKKTAVIPK